MNNKTLQEMNDAYKDCPVRTSEYTIDGKKYIVKSHFVGAKELNDVLYRIAFEQAMDEVLKTAYNYGKLRKKACQIRRYAL